MFLKCLCCEILNSYTFNIHDGSVNTSEDAVRIMVKFQHDKDFTHDEGDKVVTFLKILNGNH